MNKTAFIIKTDEITRQLKNVLSLVPNSRTIPILSNLLLELTKDNKLVITATNTLTTITLSVDIDVQGDIGELRRIAAPAVAFYNAISSISSPQAEIVIGGDYSLDITAFGEEYKIAGVDPTIYPTAKQVMTDIKRKVAKNILIRAIDSTLFATAKVEMRPQLQGVLLTQEEKRITFVATETHKLAKFSYELECASNEEQSDLILPRETLSIMKNILSLGDASKDVVIQNDNENICLSFDNYIINTRLISGKFPNYKPIIPKDNPIKITINRDMFLRTVQNIATFVSGQTEIISLALNGDCVTVSANGAGDCMNGSKKIACTHSGEDMIIGFNSTFLRECLSAIKSDFVSMEFSHPNRAALIMPAKDDKEQSKEDLLILLMPVDLGNLR